MVDMTILFHVIVNEVVVLKHFINAWFYFKKSIKKSRTKEIKIKRIWTKFDIKIT